LSARSGSEGLRAAIAGSTARRVAPVLVTLATLGWVLARFDLARIAAALDRGAAAVLVPALLAYGAATLLLESASILRLLPARPPGFGAWTAARIKCASYLLTIVNYALGGATLSVLLRRRAGIGLGEAAGIVLLISATDLLVVLGLGALAAATGGGGTPAVRAGAVALTGVGWFGGILLLRAPTPLGPLERLRSLAVFDALRSAAISRLLELLALRAVFACCFIGVAGAAFSGFGVEIAPMRLVVGMMILAVVGALPIAVSGLGTGQVAAVYVFRGVAPPETLIAISLVLSAGLITLRAAMGALFAREFLREALEPGRREAR
jgi:hypothetical protein